MPRTIHQVERPYGSMPVSSPNLSSSYAVKLLSRPNVSTQCATLRARWALAMVTG
ncbi:hypothetical protein ACIRPK_23840 [Kitasatospora sp. NPDC101801]|uniref:hypothetical protein n=1 Tax=Kitasatospora sp. NPDC101801 TaxID=3364103 RepID=UPI0037FDCDCD